MKTSRLARTGAVAATALALCAGAGLVPAATASATAHRPAPHVLLLSVDGLHQQDLAWWVQHHPGSAIAALVRRGAEYTGARTPFPSDSFPGMVGQVTGGHPRTTGVYYDVTWNRELIDPSASKDATPDPSVCRSTAPGAQVAFDESADRDSSRLDAGQGLPGLPGSILDMTGQPRAVIDPTTLPIDPRTCTRVYPHSYLHVNTVFEVAHQHGLRTAWSDKHPAYDILQGPSGQGIDDLFTPEINSFADGAGHDWTQVNSLTQQYDGYKVRAVENEIKGLDHSGRTRVGMPAVLGMNFQSVSTAEKLPTSDGQPGGYEPGGVTPGPVLQSALGFVDRELGSMVATLRSSHQLARTTIILSAKHGQSPTDPAALRRIDDGAVVDGLNAAWKSAHPEAPQPLVAFSLNDDGMLLWFGNGDRTPQADAFARDYLLRYDGNGTGADGHAKATDVSGAPTAYTAAGLRHVDVGPEAAARIGTSVDDARVPDLIGDVQHGVVYTGKTSKIAEHGGDDPQDRHVPLVVAGPRIGHRVVPDAVETVQIAPTILRLLGLDPAALQAVRIEGTRVLPGLR